jgi:hypothetical protein
MACSLVHKYPSFVGMSYCRLQGKKSLFLYPEVGGKMFHRHGGACTKYVTPQKTLIWIAFAVCLSHLYYYLCFIHKKVCLLSLAKTKLWQGSLDFMQLKQQITEKKIDNEELRKPYSSRDLLRWLNQERHSICSSHDVRSHIEISTRKRGILTESLIFLLRNSRHVRTVPHISPWPLRSTSFPYHCSLVIILFNIIQGVQLKPSIDAREA